MSKRDTNRRWKYLKFTKNQSYINKSGDFILCPQHIPSIYPGVEPQALLIKDRLFKFLSPDGTPTAKWGNYIEKSSFIIKYDSILKRFSIILSYNSLLDGAPFKKQYIDLILNSNHKSYKRAQQWITRKRNMYSNNNNNMVSIDPGFRKPITYFDFNNHPFVTVYKDFSFFTTIHI